VDNAPTVRQYPTETRRFSDGYWRRPVVFSAELGRSPSLGVRLPRKKGFTLIELLIVVVIIGILAAIAIPKFASTKQKAYTASMKTDLRNLVTAQEAYFSNASAYANALGLLSTSFHTSAGNTVAAPSASPTGWSATVTNSYVPTTASGHICGVWVGGATSQPGGITADSIEGAPACS